MPKKSTEKRKRAWMQREQKRWLRRKLLKAARENERNYRAFAARVEREP